MLGESVDIKGEVPFHLHIVSTYTHRTEIFLLRACVYATRKYIYVIMCRSIQLRIKVAGARQHGSGRIDKVEVGLTEMV